MNRQLIALTFFFFSLIFSACTPEMTVVEVSAVSQPQQIEAPLTVAEPTAAPTQNQVSPPASDSCLAPTPDHAPYCAAVEAQILASTVRLEIHRWSDVDGKRGDYIDGSIGHGTVINGRYLVTHNHFSIPLDSIEGVVGEHLHISIYNANGQVILDSVKPSGFRVATQNSQTVVLDFGEYVGEGLFTMLGIPSAPYQNWQTLTLTPGTELAQINWDNHTAFVEWTTVKTIETQQGTPYIDINNDLLKGASGGGVFLNGIHIGNNWSNTDAAEPNANVNFAAFSTAALNSELLLN